MDVKCGLGNVSNTILSKKVQFPVTHNFASNICSFLTNIECGLNRCCVCGLIESEW